MLQIPTPVPLCFHAGGEIIPASRAVCVWGLGLRGWWDGHNLKGPYHNTCTVIPLPDTCKSCARPCCA